MNIEGAVKLGYRKELDGDRGSGGARSRSSSGEPRAAYDKAKAVNAVMGGGIDDVIDPADYARLDRQWPETAAAGAAAHEKKYPYIDPW